jgi:hypothetical protein
MEGKLQVGVFGWDRNYKAAEVGNNEFSRVGYYESETKP